MSSAVFSILNFSESQEAEVGEMVSSHPFSPINNDKTKWTLCVSPRGVDEASKDYISVHLRLISSDKAHTRINFRISILNSAGEEMYAIGNTHPFDFEEGKVMGRKKFIRRDVVFDERNGLLFHDTLTLSCEIDVLPESVTVPQCRLSDDLLLIFENQNFTDVTISAGGKELGAHKAVLAARSPVFAAMFEHSTKEKATNRVEIIDLEYKVVREMLIFIYSGKSPNVKDMAYDLLPAADTYGLDRLKLICEETLCWNLSVDNSSHTLVLADMHSSYSLKAEAINFITSHATEVTETAGWKEMIKFHPSLVSEAFRALVNKQCHSISPPPKNRKLK
jgi:speckle-type POZ protein